MKKLIYYPIIILGLGMSLGTAHGFGWNNSNPWGGCDDNDWPEWTPMYWMEEILGGNDDCYPRGMGYGSQYGLGYGRYPLFYGSPYGGGYGYPAVPPVQSYPTPYGSGGGAYPSPYSAFYGSRYRGLSPYISPYGNLRQGYYGRQRTPGLTGLWGKNAFSPWSGGFGNGFSPFGSGLPGNRLGRGFSPWSPGGGSGMPMNPFTGSGSSFSPLGGGFGSPFSGISPMGRNYYPIQ